MSTDELDAFRSELLRQKIIFEAELRRQRESFEERLSTVAQELAAREADCRNLQSVITILGRKVDALTEQVTRRPPTPRRMPTPPRTPSLIGEEDLIKPPQSFGGGNSARRPATTPSTTSAFPQAHASSPSGNTFVRRPSPLISATSPSTISVMHRVSSLSALSRTSSPARSMAPPTAPEATGVAPGAVPPAAHEVGPAANSRHTPAAHHSANPSGGHPYRALSARRKNGDVGSARGSAASASHDGDSSVDGGITGRTPRANPSPRSIRGRRRSNSLKGKRRTSSAHRLNDVKATDDW